MKPTLLEWCSLLSAIAVGLWLILLQAGGARATPVDLGSAIDGQAGKDLRIHFEYQDFANRPHKFECDLSADAARQLEEAFGLSLDHEADLDELDRRLESKIEDEARTHGMHLRAEVGHTPHVSPDPEEITWDRLPLTPIWDDRYPAHRRQDAPAIKQQILGKVATLACIVFRDFLLEHGFENRPPCEEKVRAWGGSVEAQPGDKKEEKREFVVAYRHLADQARKHLASCQDAFVKEAGTSDPTTLLQLLLAAFQEMPKVKPLRSEDGRYQAGFWVPTKVVRRGGGDCDSKATALCALWQPIAAPQIILVVKDPPGEKGQAQPAGVQAEGHALLGIEAIPGPEQHYEQIGLRKYVYYEVLSREDRAKVLPGQLLVAHALTRARICMTNDCGGDL